MKIKIREATPKQLDGLVSKCENILWLAYENALNNETPMPPRPSEYLRDYAFHPDHFRPSTDWAQGGPIIEREKITLQPNRLVDGWYATTDRASGNGETPLIAAMRCFVASKKLGDTVEIPEELQ